MTGCAQVQPRMDSADAAGGPSSLTQVLEEDISHPSSFSPRTRPDGIAIRGIVLKNTKFDIPITVNSRVESWVDYFCNRGRPHFQKYLDRSKFFIPYIVPLLKQNGLPEDLVYLAMIESGFNNLARSRAKAVGPWQFISATGKRYGLNVNWWVDERRDIKKSTFAAVEYLRDLYTIFQSWELAAASYNAGEAKIARAVRRYGSKDFWVISKHQFLRQETRDYVPKIIAAALIAKNRAQFGFDLDNLTPGADEVVAANGEVVKVEKTDQPVPDQDYQLEKEADAQRLGLANFDDDDGDETDAPTVKTIVTSPDFQKTAVQSVVGEVRTQPLAKPVQTPHMTKKGEVGGEDLMEFEVQSPADLLKVARAAGLSYPTVKSLNPEILRWCTPPTLNSYRLRLPVSVKDRFLTTYNHQAFPRRVQFLTYKVQRGETLSRIAKHFGIKVDPISDLNRFHPKALLVKGTQVLLPMPNDRSRTFASLEVRDPPEKRRSPRHHRRKKAFRVSYKDGQPVQSLGHRSKRFRES